MVGERPHVILDERAWLILRSTASSGGCTRNVHRRAVAVYVKRMGWVSSQVSGAGLYGKFAGVKYQRGRRTKGVGRTPVIKIARTIIILKPAFLAFHGAVTKRHGNPAVVLVSSCRRVSYVYENDEVKRRKKEKAIEGVAVEGFSSLYGWCWCWIQRAARVHFGSLRFSLRSGDWGKHQGRSDEEEEEEEARTRRKAARGNCSWWPHRRAGGSFISNSLRAHERARPA